MKIICINGVPQSGKDTFVEYCMEYCGYFCQNYSTVDFVKDIAKMCGWDGEKTPENRAFLSNLKQLLVEWKDVPFNEVSKKINAFAFNLERNNLDLDKAIVFVHVREPEEIQKFVERLDAKTLLIRRQEAEDEAASNDSDANVFNYTYDWTITNDDTKEILRAKAEGFLIGLGVI